MSDKWAALILTLAATVATPALAQEASYTSDETGRRFRVEFDPANQFRLGALGGLVRTGNRWQQAFSVQSGVGWRGTSRSGKHGDEVRWQFDHRIFWGQVTPAMHGVRSVPPLDASAYHGTWLRKADISYVMIPTTPPKNLYIPMDVGVDTLVGRVRIAPLSSGPQVVRVTVGQAAILFDPWRARRFGNSLELGIGIRYDADWVDQSDSIAAQTIHRLAPFTMGTGRWRWQDSRGLTLFDFMGTWFPHWSSQGTWSWRSAEAKGSFERVLIAVNDQPIALVTDAAFLRNSSIGTRLPSDELRVQVGLRLGVQFK